MMHGNMNINFDEECSKFVDERKQAKLQWLWDPSPTVQMI